MVFYHVTNPQPREMKGMAKNQKSYTPEFKQQIVDLYNAGGTSYPQLEREYGLNRSTISGWIKQLSPIRVSEDNLHTYQDTKEARRAIFEYIEGWYNRKRIHSAIGYITPQQKQDEIGRASCRERV